MIMTRNHNDSNSNNNSSNDHDESSEPFKLFSDVVNDLFHN